jgi:hypothetical protein
MRQAPAVVGASYGHGAGVVDKSAVIDVAPGAAAEDLAADVDVHAVVVEHRGRIARPGVGAGAPSSPQAAIASSRAASSVGDVDADERDVLMRARVPRRGEAGGHGTVMRGCSARYAA